MTSVPVVIFAVLGALCALLAAWIMDRMPAKCFCDYDETPDERHQPPRLNGWLKVVCVVRCGREEYRPVPVFHRHGHDGNVRPEVLHYSR